MREYLGIAVAMLCATIFLLGTIWFTHAMVERYKFLDLVRKNTAKQACAPYSVDDYQVSGAFGELWVLCEDNRMLKVKY